MSWPADDSPIPALAGDAVRESDARAPGPARSAIVTFGSARDAGRRVAGVAAAARIVRELADADFTEAWLRLPDGETLDDVARADLDRLAGTIQVRVTADAGMPSASGQGFGAEPLRLDGDRLIPAQLLRGAPSGPFDAMAADVISLSAPGAARRILQGTGKEGDGPVSRWLNRPVSRAISQLIVQIPGIRPVHATAGTALLALLMFASLVAGGEAGLLAGAILFHAASVFDGVDGEIARATFRTSRAGALLDSVIDETTNLLFVIGVIVNLAAAGAPLAPAIGLWGLLLFALGLALIAWRTARSAEPFSFDMVKHHYQSRFAGAPVSRLIRFMTIVTGRDFYALLFMALALVGEPAAVLYIFAAAATIWILFVLGSLRAVGTPVPHGEVAGAAATLQGNAAARAVEQR